MNTTDLTDALPSTQPAAPVRNDRGAVLFVWTTWAVMAVGALAFIYTYGCNLPFLDEWGLVGAVTGDQPVTLAWLWSQHNQHRIVLPRLIYLGLARLTGADFRAGTYFSGLALAALAAALVLAARRLRGRTSYADAFFPLALLHAGHWENLLLSFQIAFVVPTLLGVGLLLLILHSRAPMTWRTGLAGDLCLLALPLCGAHGLPLVPPLAVWLVAWAWRGRRLPGPAAAWRLPAVAALAAAAVALVPLYFVGYQPVAEHPPSPGWEATGKVGLQFLTVGFGSAVITRWNYARFVVLALLAGGTATLTAACWRRSAERIRCLGLLLFLTALIGLALGIGWGRAGIDRNAGFAVRYSILAVPLLCAVYLSFEVAGPAACARFVRTALFIILLLLCPTNTRMGLASGRERRDLFRAAERDLSAHLPAEVVARRHPILHPVPAFLTQRLEWLRRAGVGAFKGLAAPEDRRPIRAVAETPAAFNADKP